MIEQIMVQLVVCAITLVTSDRLPPTPIPMEACLIQGRDTDLPVFVADLKNCSRFYLCNGGNAFLMSCPGDLHFNPHLRVCDFPFRSGCELSQETSPTAAQLITIELPAEQDLDDDTDEDESLDASDDSDSDKNDNENSSDEDKSSNDNSDVYEN